MSQLDGGGARFVVTPVRGRDRGEVVVPRPRQARPAPQTVYWRLLSRNNRQLGRSPSSFRSAAEAAAAAAHLGVVRRELEPTVVRLVGPVRWLWTTTLDGVPAAVSGRTYERERVASHALQHFLAAVVDALPALGSAGQPAAAALLVQHRLGLPAGDVLASAVPPLRLDAAVEEDAEVPARRAVTEVLEHGRAAVARESQ